MAVPRCNEPPSFDRRSALLNATYNSETRDDMNDTLNNIAYVYEGWPFAPVVNPADTLTDTQRQVVRYSADNFMGDGMYEWRDGMWHGRGLTDGVDVCRHASEWMLSRVAKFSAGDPAENLLLAASALDLVKLRSWGDTAPPEVQERIIDTAAL